MAQDKGPTPITNDVKSDAPGNAQKDPNDWTTGDEPATGAQLSYLKTLSEEAGVDMPDSLSKSAASQKIEELQAKTGRGQDS